MPQNTSLIGTPDDDTLVPGPQITLIDGLGGDDTLLINRSTSHRDFDYDMAMAAGAGGVTLADGTEIRNVENVVLGTGSGNDTFRADPSGNNFYWDAGAGSDTLILDYSTQGGQVVLAADHGIDVSLDGQLTGHATGFESLFVSGSQGNDILTDSKGADSLYGDGGDDVILSYAGADTLGGGDGMDHVSIFRQSATASLAFDGMAANGDAGTTMSDGTTVIKAEYLTVFAGSGDDTLAGGAWGDFFKGGDGHDVLSGNGGDDRLEGGAGTDSLYGGQGNDQLDGGAGADMMNGALGNDVYYVDNSGDTVVEGASAGGSDIVLSSVDFSLAGEYVENLVLTGDAMAGTGNGLANTITGNNDANQLSGMAGSDLLHGGGGGDRLDGGLGADTMWGGAGDDTYVVDNAGDVVSEHQIGSLDDGGVDTVEAVASYSLTAYVENLALNGYQAIDGTGNSMDNRIAGNANVNVLKGLAGDDSLEGKGGNDTLTGGAGADTFVFEAAGAANGFDHVTDFQSGTDMLMFSGSDYGFSSGHSLTADELVVGGPATGASGQFLYNTVNHILYWDADGAGSGAARPVAAFDNGAMLHKADFIFG